MRLVVLGGGPAGVEAAKTAAPYADVTLISAEPVGTWRPLSTWVWLRAATADGPQCDLVATAARAEGALAAWRRQCAAELAALGVAVMTGRGRLGEPGEVLVETGDPVPQRLPADAVIVATGALQALPPELAPDGLRVLDDTQVPALTALPRSVLVLGDGPVGFELCQIFSRLGSTVAWLVPEDAPRTHVAPEVDGYLTRLLERQGVQVIPHSLVQRLERGESEVRATTAGGEHRAEIGLLAIGRRPDPAAVGLEAAEVATDIYGQTKRRGVYLVGDALAPRAASVAMAQARAAALHAVRRSSAPADPDQIVLSFMHRPQVAKLGRLPADGASRSITVGLSESAAAYAADTTEGFLTLAWDQGERLVGALAVADQAAEILAPVAVAMRAGLRLAELASSYGPHPSASELVALAARKAERSSR